MSELADFLEALDLVETGPGRFRAGHARTGRGVVFGGELLAQAIVAATRVTPGMEVRSVQALFARGTLADRAIELEVEQFRSGRSLASTTVTVSQEERRCARALVLSSVEEPDLVRHQAPMPKVHPVDASPPTDAFGFVPGEVRVPNAIDLLASEQSFPAELSVWTRCPGVPDDRAIHQGLVANATDGFLIGTAMLPHEGLGQADAHVTVSTGVLTHTIDFHEPADVTDWLLIHQRSTYAGRGRCFGVGEVFAADGRLLASFAQQALLRYFPEGQSPEGRETTIF